MTATSLPTTVRVAQAADIPALARTLALAFDDDPVGRWFAPYASTRLRDLEKFFAAISLRRYAMPLGEVRMTAERNATALWVPPGNEQASTWESLRMMPALLVASGRILPRVLRFEKATAAVHPHEPHWYLPLIGVAPRAQGRGYGSALLEHALEQVDADGMPAYLEATTERSRALYRRHGFEVMDVMHLPDGPPMWRMWRDPR